MLRAAVILSKGAVSREWFRRSKTRARDYISRHVAPKRKPRARETYEALLRLHIAPAIGALRLTELRRWHVSKMHQCTEQRGAANRALRLVSAVWNFAAAEYDGLDLGQNPAKGIARNKEQGRQRFLTSVELEQLGKILKLAETTGLPYQIDESKPSAKHAPKPENRIRPIDPFAIAAIKLLLLTGARRRELLHAKWKYLDSERGLLNLPDSKTGQKPVFISKSALDILESLPRFDECPFIFPGRSGERPRADLKAPWRVITQAAKLGGLRLHDLRHSFASVGASGGVGLPVIGSLLGHSTPAMTARYAHIAAQAARTAADLLGDSIIGAPRIA
jgi:integrase